MRPLRPRHPADEYATALVRARVAHLSAAIRHADDDQTGGNRSRPEEPDPARVEPDPGVLGHRPSPGGGFDSDPRGYHDQLVDDGRRSQPSWAEAVQDRLPLSVRQARVGLTRAHVVVIALVVVLGLAAAAIVLRMGRPDVVPVESEVASTGSPLSRADPTRAPTQVTQAAPTPGAEDLPAGPDDASGGPIVVHVAGLVAKPGVVEIAAGSRVVDAIEAAGGATSEADLTPLNLARVLSDGEQVLVTAEPPAGAPIGAPSGNVPSGPGDGTASGPVNLNSATADELDTLPGIGPTLAGRILDWRAENGRFSTIEELREVSGIGDQRFAEIEPLVTV